MGNAIGKSKKRAKIMKTDGEIFKMKLPATAGDVLADYPAGHVLLESGTVRSYGIRAPELEPEEELKPGKIYFLVDMPKFPEPRTRRTRSVANTISTAEERLKGFMLRQKTDPGLGSGSGSGGGPVRVKLRVPRAQIERLMEGSKDEAEVGQRILDFCLQNSSDGQTIGREV